MEHRRLHLFHGGGEEMSTSSLILFTLLITPCFFPHISSADFKPPTSVLLNCGSGDSATAPNDSRPFLPDSNSNSVSLSPSSSSVSVADPKSFPAASSLYQTARVFKGESSYEFMVSTAGVHVLRLHFFPFSAHNSDLFSAVFNVSALGRFRLLADFSVRRDAALPVIKEYLLWVNAGKLDVTFTPSVDGSSPPLAFVNAVEVFTAPTELIRVTDQFAGLSSNVGLETVHRINMGGPLIVPTNDTLWRTWIPDGDYLYMKNLAVVVSTTNPIKYRDDGGGSTREIAPDRVYSTAQAMNRGEIIDPQFNITWRFNVTAGASHLVRMHFYIVLSNVSPTLYFNTYVDNQTFYQDLQPSSFTFDSSVTPFYWDKVFNDSVPAAAVNSRVMLVSVGRSQKSNPSTANATLNGLEIMRILEGDPLDEGSGGGKKKTLLYILIPSVLGGVALLVLLISYLYLSASRRRRPLAREPPPERKEAAVSWSPLPRTGPHSITTVSKVSQGTIATSPRTPRVINLGLHVSFDEIRFATNDFDEGFIIGAGGFGKVYRGELRDGTKVAVKRGMPGSMQGYPEFQTEVMVLSKIRHRHLVSLIGYCDEHAQMILVYEFMEKGPLKNFLYGRGAVANGGAPFLSWKQRLEICIGAARGIHYLHTGYAQGIIHRDLKSSNILLGEDYVAKVSDFGLSRLGPSLGETHVSTGVKGSFGYLDPEYFKTQQLTDKSDVYSFGVVLFEVLCARPVIDPLLSREQLNLAEWAIMAQRQGRLEHIVDPRLRGTVNPNSLRKFGETAVKCLAEYGVDRPSIGDVLWNLEYCLQLQETELRREPHEDSGNCVSQLPVPSAVRRMPSSNPRIEEDRGDGGGAGSLDVEQMEFTNSHVFSQLITREGR